MTLNLGSFELTFIYIFFYVVFVFIFVLFILGYFWFQENSRESDEKTRVEFEN